ncbi:MAG: FtsK/SpoIIIE domain-containing protein [Jatrophihabitantaceae bacterium]
MSVASRVEGTTIADLRPLLADTFGGRPDQPIASNGRPIPDHAALGEPSLRSGCTITLGTAGDRPPDLSSVLQLRVLAGPDCGGIVALRRGRQVIGRDRSADVRIDDPDVSRRHVELQVEVHGLSVRDLGSTNGTMINGRPNAGQPEPIEPGCLIGIGNSVLSVIAIPEPPAATSPDGNGQLLVHRPPRIGQANLDTVVEFPMLAESNARPRARWLVTLLPALLAVGLAVLMRTPQLLAFALLGPLTLGASAITDRRDWRKSTGVARSTSAAAEQAARTRLTCLLADEASYRQRQYPDAATVFHAVSVPDCRLWERRLNDPDFLAIRLGTADQPARVRTCRGSGRGPEAQVAAAPVTVALTDGPLGIAGPQSLARATARWSIAQVLALHSPEEVGVFALLDDSAEWRWLRWISGSAQRIASTPEQRQQLVEDLHQLVTTRLAGGGQQVDRWPGPWVVVLIDPAQAVAGLAGLRRVLERGPAVGVSAVSVAADPRSLPPNCRASVIAVSDTGTELDVQATGQRSLRAVADRVSADWANNFARMLAPLADADADPLSRLPTQQRLVGLSGLETVDARSVSQRWAHQSQGALATIGVGAKGNFELDLVRDGPHLLIAGTTGSGKSELLRSLVVALAIGSPPSELNFVLIDYKGGAAFSDCALLPHTLGVVTDLDAHLTRRALVSLDAELRRREAAFAVAGVADLTGYRQSSEAHRNPLGRLILIIDEFASLAEELPDFLTGLLGIAQRGRSLGVHLVLATQRPAGAVSADIKANLSLRIALRVTDPAESSDVIGSDLASRIPRSQPGRAFARLGDGELVEFQTARIGLPLTASEPITIQELDGWNRPVASAGAPAARTDVAELTAAMHAAAGQLTLPARPWLAPLPDLVLVKDLAEPEDEFQLAIGLIDDPAQQRQYPYLLDLTAGGSAGFIGGPRSGRTTALRTTAGQAIRRLSSAQLHLYLIDCAGRGFDAWSELAHCGAVLNPNDPACIARLVGRLNGEIADRQRKLAELGVSSLAEGLRMGCRLPVMLLVVDGWEGLCRTSDEYDAGRTADGFIRLLRDGPAAGLTVLISGDRSALGLRLGAALGRRLLLPMTDRADYANAGIRAAALPTDPSAGRAIATDTGLEVQLALLDRDPTASAQTSAALGMAKPARPEADQPAIRIRALPERVEYRELVGQVATEPGQFLLGLGGDDAAPVHCDIFAAHSRFLIAGPARSGRSNCALLIAEQAQAIGYQILIAAPARSPLSGWATSHACGLVEPGADPGAEFGRFSGHQLIVIDDAEQFQDTPAGDYLLSLVARDPAPVIVSARTDDLLVSFRGLGVEVRRHRTGILLQPAPVDGELLGVRLGVHTPSQPVGRGLLITDRTRQIAPDGLPIQVAR